jgi:hypothetical protein
MATKEGGDVSDVGPGVVTGCGGMVPQMHKDSSEAEPGSTRGGGMAWEQSGAGGGGREGSTRGVA